VNDRLKIGFSGALERSREYLKAELAQGPRLRVSLEKSAIAQGYNPANLHAAARTLGIVSDRIRVEGMGWRARWSLPPENADGVRPHRPPPDPSTPLPVTDDSPIAIGEQLQKIQQLQRLVDIYRRTDGELAFIDSLPGTECTLRQIKRRFGGGRYNVEGQEFIIEGSPVSPEGESMVMRPRGSQVVQAPPAATGTGIDTGALLMTVFKQQGDILIALLTKRETAVSDPVAMFKAVDDAVARRLATAPPATPVEQLLKMYRDGMAMGQGMAEGRDPEEAGWSKMLETVAPALNGLVARFAPVPPAAAPVAVVPPPAALPAHPEGLPVTPLARVMVDLAPALPQLLEEAKKGTPAATIAEYIHQNADQAQYDALAEAAESPQFVEQLLEELGRLVAPIKAGWAVPWLRTVVEALNVLLVEDRRDDGGNAVGTADVHPAGAGGGSAPDRPRGPAST
jgi:hypothetical protein